jgi:hypothetical protein
MKKTKFLIWKQITVKGKPDLYKFKVSAEALNMSEKIRYPREKTIDLVKLQVKDLEISAEFPTTTQIYARAKELGLELCPAWVGPQLRVDYEDQPIDEWLFVAMEPIADSGGDPSVFRLGRDGGLLWLRGSWAEPDSRWYPDYQFVFSFPQVQTLSSFDPLRSIPPKSRELKPRNANLSSLKNQPSEHEYEVTGKKHVRDRVDPNMKEPNKNHIRDVPKMVSGLNYDAYLKRLVELGEKVNGGGLTHENYNQWLNHLLGYIEAARELIK